jgi:hypothetical protein
MVSALLPRVYVGAVNASMVLLGIGLLWPGGLSAALWLGIAVLSVPAIVAAATIAWQAFQQREWGLLWAIIVALMAVLASVMVGLVLRPR